MSQIPAGSLAFSGFANSTPQEVKFRSNTGTVLTHPVAAPVIGNPSSDYCDGLVQLDGGNYICGSTLTFSGHTWGGEKFNNQFASGTPIGVIDDEPRIRSGVASDGTYAWGIYYHFSGGLFIAFSRWANDGTYSTQVTTIAQGTNAGDVLAIAGGIIYWGARNDTSIRRWDTSGGGSALSDWSVTAPAGYGLYDGTILGLQDGTIVVAWRKIAGGPAVLKRYDSTGSVLNTYAVPGTTNNTGPFDGGSLAQGLTASTFWFGSYRTDLGGGFAGYTLREYTASTGATVNEFSPASDSYNWDSPFVVVRSAIGASVAVPLPTPLAPQTPCAPTTQISGGGTGNAGCNTGGTGFTPYTVTPGTIPIHPDPDAGESMVGKHAVDLWIALHHRGIGSPTTVTYRRSFEELGHLPTYQGGRKPKGLLSIGDIEHGLGSEDGGFEAASIDITLSEAVDRWIRSILDGEDLEGDEVEVYLVSPEAASAGLPPHVLMRAVIDQPKTSSGLQAMLSAVDVLFSIIGPFGERPQWPFWTFGDVFDATTCPADVRSRVIPILYGEKSDEGPTTGTAKGLIPLHYVGTFLKTTGITRADSTGKTLAAVVAELQVSVTAHTTVADWASIIGVGDAQALEDLGTVPDTYVALAEVIGFADLDALLGMGTTPAPSTERYGFFAAGLGPWYRFHNLYGSDSGGGDVNAKHDRTLIDVASRSDVLMYGVNYTTPYEAFVSADGVTFWLSGVWVHESSPLFQDHVNGVVNMTVNAIGIEDVGDGTGLPLIHAHYCQHHWIENFLINNWTSGPYTTAIDYPQWPDGTAKVRSSRFVSRQSFETGALGSPSIGLTAGWYVDGARSLTDWFKLWNASTETFLGVNRFGQITLGYIDTTADTSTWPRIRHVTDIYGSVDATYGEQRENVVTGSCDWDPDAQKFRVGPVVRESTVGIARLKDIRKPGQLIESTILADQSQLTWVLDQRLTRLRFGQIVVTVPGKIDLLDYDVDSAGILLTTTEGPGSDGYVDQPMWIKRRRFSVADRTVTDTLIDIAAVLSADGSPS